MGYPNKIPELNSLRFVAAFWVVLFHLGTYIDLTFGNSTSLISAGPRAVDVFFILSGFVMAHVYLPALRDKRFNYTTFLINRFARLYPLHLATILMFAVALAGAGLIGVDIKQSFPVADLGAHLFMVHAWGFLDGLSWNGPSWSISAEWFAYLTFPLTAVIMLRCERAPAQVAGMFIVAMLVGYLLLKDAGATSIFVRTYDCSILRIVPEFIGGGLLYLAGTRMKLARPLTIALLTVSTGTLVVAAHYGAQPIWIVCASAVVILMLAELSKTGSSWLASKPLFYAGEISYSIYMVHILVFLVGFKALGRNVGWNAVTVLLLVFVAAAITHRFIEVPCRAYLRRISANMSARTRPA